MRLSSKNKSIGGLPKKAAGAFCIGLTPAKESSWLQPDMCCVEIDGPRYEVKILAITRPESSNPNIQAFLQTE